MRARKGREGYVLLYVVVVIILLSVVAMTICTISLRNLQSQQASLERTRQLYAAEGEIERFVANVESEALEVTAVESEKTGAAKTAFENQMTTICENGSSVTLGDKSWDAAGTACTVTVTAVDGTVSVSARIVFQLTIPESTEENAGTGGESEEPPQETYQITVDFESYKSYTIDSAGTG